MSDYRKISSSFRDPNGYLFYKDQILYRQINHPYKPHFHKLHESGLYETLVNKGWITPYTEATIEPDNPEIAYLVIQPEQLPFISYPYEWCFSQLKDAALLTLKIQKTALKFGMTLKDSSAYNIQYHPATGKPVLIDTLSFETYSEGNPWVAYRQFCQHFLGPLALMAHTDVRLNQLSKIYIDGPPLSLISKLLPFKTKLNFGLLSHIHLHAKAQSRFAGTPQPGPRQAMSKNNLLALIDNLERTTQKLIWVPGGTEWGEYYQDTNYSREAHLHKHGLIKEFIDEISPDYVWDLGANTGLFSRIAQQLGATTIAFDIDPGAVEKNYLQVKSEKENNLLPLLLDLTNPSPGLGWENQERDSLYDRPKPDLIMALALIHHLAITNNTPLEMVASMFSNLAPWLIIEFVPKQDSQVQKLLATREDIFNNYHQDGFEHAFQHYYELIKIKEINHTLRRLYLFKRRDNPSSTTSNSL
jgi:ribosomal protein L11 methylase PrmA